MSKENNWIKKFYRLSGYMQSIIVHGNINDYYHVPSDLMPVGADSPSSTHPSVFQKEKGEWVTILTALTLPLQKQGYEHLYYWDPVVGCRSLSERDLTDFISNNNSQSTNEQNNAKGYDMGEYAEAQSLFSMGESVNADDFFRRLLDDLTSSQLYKKAYIIDFANCIFGDTLRLPENERRWVLEIGKVLRDNPLHVDGYKLRSAPLLIFVDNKLSSIPLCIYQGVPSSCDISIPKPDRATRLDFIKSYPLWFISNTKLYGNEFAMNEFADATDGLCVRDLIQMAQMSKLENDAKTPQMNLEKLINLYKFGEKSSPWEDLDHKTLSNFTSKISERVMGQPEAIEKVWDMLLMAFTGLSGLQHSKKQKTPKGVLFFVGPTGVGKTELAKAVANFLFRDEDSCIRFDMSEYNHETSDQRLVGAPPGYVGYEEGGQLTNAVKERPFSVLLFDEIEKAHPKILDKFLQILEDGRLTDGKGQTVFFNESVIIFTSNIGASEVNVDEDPICVKNEFIKRVQDHFNKELKRPELLNRIGDNIVPFNFILDENFMINIAKSKFSNLKEKLQEKYRIADIVFGDEDLAYKAIANSVDRKLGGRGMLNALVRYIYKPLAKWLFDNTEEKTSLVGTTIEIIQIPGEMIQFHFIEK